MLPTPSSSSERPSEVTSSCVVSPLLLPRTYSPAISSLSDLSRRSSVYSIDEEPNSGSSSESNLSTLSRIHHPQNFPEWVARLREEMAETELPSEDNNFERWIWLPSALAYNDFRGNPFEDEFAGDGMAAFSSAKRPQSQCLPLADTCTSLDINALMASYLVTQPDGEKSSSNLENETLLQDAYVRAVSDVEHHAQQPNRVEIQSEPYAKFEIKRTIGSRSSLTFVETTKEVYNQLDRHTLPDEQALQKDNSKTPSSARGSDSSSPTLCKLSSGLACQAKGLSHSLTKIGNEQSETIAGREYSFDMDSRTEDKKLMKKGPKSTFSFWKRVFTWKESRELR